MGAADRQNPDRARIATFTYSFARIDAALKCASKREPKGSSWLIRLHETGCPRCGIGAGDLDSGGTLSSEKAKPRSPASAAAVEAQ